MSLVIDTAPLVTCPNCDGDGEIGSWVQYRGEPPEDTTALCGVCQGKGKVTRKIAARYEAILRTVERIGNTGLLSIIDLDCKVADFEKELERERDIDTVATL